MPVQPTAEQPNGASQSFDELKQKSEQLKAKIEEEKRKHDMPLDSTLGDPEWEEKAADGRLDIPEETDD